MKYTFTGLEALEPKNNLVGIDVDEIALVAKGSRPVHPGAVITLVKATPEPEVEIPDEDLGAVSRFIKALKNAVAPIPEPDATEVEIDKAKKDAAHGYNGTDANPDPDKDGDDDRPGSDNNPDAEKDAEDAAKKKKMNKSIEVSESTLLEVTSSFTALSEQVAELNKSFHESVVAKANAGAATHKETTGHVTNSTSEANQFVFALKASVAQATTVEELTKAMDSLNSFNGKKMSNSNAKSTEQELHGEANNDPIESDGDAEDAAEALQDHTVTSQDGSDPISDPDPVDVHTKSSGVNPKKLENVHAAKAPRDVHTHGSEPVVHKAEVVDINGQINAAFAANFGPVLAKLESLQTQVTEVSSIAKSASEAVEVAKTEMTTVVQQAEQVAAATMTTALEKAEAQLFAEARANNPIPKMISHSLAPEKKEFTRDDLKKMSFFNAVTSLTNLQSTPTV